MRIHILLDIICGEKIWIERGRQFRCDMSSWVECRKIKLDESEYLSGAEDNRDISLHGDIIVVTYHSQTIAAQTNMYKLVINCIFCFISEKKFSWIKPRDRPKCALYRSIFNIVIEALYDFDWFFLL